MFFMKCSFHFILFVLYVDWSLIEEISSNVIDSNIDFNEERKIHRAVHKSMLEWKARSNVHRKKRADKVVCYGDLGCFEDSGPFNYLDMLPSSPEEINTKFWVYSAKNRSEKPFLEFHFQNISSTINLSNTTTSKINETVQQQLLNNKQTSEAIYEKFGKLKNMSARIIVHGFGSSCSHVWIYEMRTALMAVEECIVLCVDWESGATLPNYVRAAANTRLVGKQLAILLKGLNKNNQLDMNRVHIIGFSLGAHAAGFAGAEIEKVHRITGLDPAGPLFESQHPSARLDFTDADFVDVIHSNGENLILGGLGSWQPMGHVDFYPNGGRVQHGCSNLFVGAVTDIIWAPITSIEGRSLCNHRRAYKFFIDSVAPRCLFPAFPCDNYESFLRGDCFSCDSDNSGNSSSVCGKMGYYADKSTGRGQLYLKTRDEEPFCAHQYKLEIHSAANDLPLRTLGRLEVELESDTGLTEVFTITDKDDAELFAGDMISQILVPHPALGFPTNLTLTYIVYKGWLTRGLSNWHINKVVLSNSFGKSYSICETMNLESNKPIHLNLIPGNCDINDSPDNDIEEDTIVEVKNRTSNFNPNSIIIKKKNTTEVVDMGKHFKVRKPTDKEYVHYEQSRMVHFPWQPIISEMDGENDNGLPATTTAYQVADTVETTTEFREIVEPILKTENRTFKRASEKRSFDEIPTSSLSSVPTAMPAESASTAATISSTNSGPAATSPSSISSTPVNSNKLVTVQLFPYRFADVFEKAERYARLTILPLLSEQFPTIFRSNVDGSQHASEHDSNGNGKGEDYDHDAKFEFEQHDNLTVINKNLTKFNSSISSSNSHNKNSNYNSNNNSSSSSKSEERNLNESASNESVNLSFLLDNPLPAPLARTQELTKRSDVSSAMDWMAGIKNETIRIELPTYKPPTVTYIYPSDINSLSSSAAASSAIALSPQSSAAAIPSPLSPSPSATKLTLAKMSKFIPLHFMDDDNGNRNRNRNSNGNHNHNNNNEEK